MQGDGSIEARVRGRTAAVAVALTLALGGPIPVRAADPEFPRDEPPPPAGPVEVDPGALPPELVAPPVSALWEARRLEASHRFADAARIYEAQWRATRDPRFLYHAAILRSRAGHHGVALRQLVECIQKFIGRGPISEALRQHLEDARLRELGATAPARLRLVEATPGGLRPVPEQLLGAGRVVVRAAGSAGGPVSGNSLEIAGPPSDEVRLEPGAWSVQVEIPGFVPVEVQRLLGPAPVEWEIVVQRRKVIVDLRFAPERAVRGARLRLRATDHDSALTLERDLPGPTTSVTLTPGPWRLEVEARRHEAAMDLTIVPGQPAIAVTLRERARRDDRRLGSDKKLAFGLLGGFVTTYFAGVGLLLGGTNFHKRVERRDAAAYEAAGLDPEMPGTIDPTAQATIEASYPAAKFHGDVALATRLHTAGAIIAGMSLGAAGTAVPVALRARPRAAFIELGVGAVLIGAGAGWLAWALGQRAQLLDDPNRRVTSAQLDRGEGHRIAASIFTGFGLGLVVFSGVVLAHDAAARRKHVRSFSATPLLAPGLAGLGLRGRF